MLSAWIVPQIGSGDGRFPRDLRFTTPAQSLRRRTPPPRKCYPARSPHGGRHAATLSLDSAARRARRGDPRTTYLDFAVSAPQGMPVPTHHADFAPLLLALAVILLGARL